jgi:hypothetical protein
MATSFRERIVDALESVETNTGILITIVLDVHSDIDDERMRVCRTSLRLAHARADIDRIPLIDESKVVSVNCQIVASHVWNEFGLTAEENPAVHEAVQNVRLALERACSDHLFNASVVFTV